MVDRFDNLPFDPYGADTGLDDRIAEALASVMADSYADVLRDLRIDEFDTDDLRGTRYNTIEEAVLDMYERGLLGFSAVFYDEEDDLWGVLIPEDSSSPV